LHCDNLLLSACNLGKIQVVKLLLERKETDLNFCCILNNAPTSPLAMACHFNHSEVVKLLLEQPGIKVNGFKLGGMLTIPLHHASEKGYVDVVKLLLKDPRLDVNEKTAIGYTALHMLMPGSKPNGAQTAKLLLAHKKIDVNLVTNSEASALAFTIMGGMINNFRLLMKHTNINVNFVGSKETWAAPIFLAISYGRLEMFKALVQHEELDVNVRGPATIEASGNGSTLTATPLYEAAKKGFPEMVRLLLACPKMM